MEAQLNYGGIRDSDPGIIKFSTGTSADVDEALRIDVNGSLKLGTSTLTPPGSSGPNSSVFFLGKKCMQGCVTTTVTTGGSGNGTFNLGKLFVVDDTSLELFMTICTTANTNQKTESCSL